MFFTGGFESLNDFIVFLEDLKSGRIFTDDRDVIDFVKNLNYDFETDIDRYLKIIRMDWDFCRLMQKIDKSYAGNLSFCDFENNFDKDFSITVLKNKAGEEIKNIFLQKHIKVDENMLVLIEKLNDICDIKRMIFAIYDIGINSRKIDDFLNLNSDYFKNTPKNVLDKKIYMISRKIYKEDRFYFLNPFSLSEKYLNDNRMIEIFFKKVID